VLFMNEYDIEDALRRANPDTEPVFTEAVITLANLAAWTNANSDGWAYWPKPCRAAKSLQEAIQAHLAYERSEYRHPREGAEITAATLKKALSPIKAFLTRQGADVAILSTFAYRVVPA
jgi:hypothetical protein